MRGMISTLAVLVMSPLLFASPASAVTCSISNTGPDSNNECTVNGGTQCSVSNDNDITISNNNSQTSGSGDAGVTGNTSGGSATSGGSSNTSSTSVGVDITNDGCNPQTTVTPPPVGGAGGGQALGASVGGRGGGQVSAVPVGGVGAGAGGLATGILGLSVVSILTGAYRLRKLTDDQGA